jgi:hypothetical protein
MKKSSMAYQFQRWIITLGAHVRALCQDLPSKKRERLCREAASCEAELRHLYAYAEQHYLDLLAYYHPFAEIEMHLFLIHEHLASKQSDIE